MREMSEIVKGLDVLGILLFTLRAIRDFSVVHLDIYPA